MTEPRQHVKKQIVEALDEFRVGVGSSETLADAFVRLVEEAGLIGARVSSGALREAPATDAALKRLIERFAERLDADERKPLGHDANGEIIYGPVKHSWPYDEVVREDRALLDAVRASGALQEAPPSEPSEAAIRAALMRIPPGLIASATLDSATIDGFASQGDCAEEILRLIMQELRAGVRIPESEPEGKK